MEGSSTRDGVLECVPEVVGDVTWLDGSLRRPSPVNYILNKLNNSIWLPDDQLKVKMIFIKSWK